MKKISFLLCLTFGLCLTLFSCQKKQVKSSAGTKLMITMEPAEKVTGVKNIPGEQVSKELSWQNASCRYTIDRQVDDNLPQVVTEAGVHYKDNRIALKVTRAGKQVFNQIFTKNSFSSIIDARFLNYAILEGIAFNEISDNKLLFTASVNCPDTDLFFPIALSITPSGGLSMHAEKLMDEHEVE